MSIAIDLNPKLVYNVHVVAWTLYDSTPDLRAHNYYRLLCNYGCQVLIAAMVEWQTQKT